MIKKLIPPGLLILLSFTMLKAQTMFHEVIPTPKRIDQTEKTVTLPSALGIVFPAEKDMGNLPQLLKGALRKYGDITMDNAAKVNFRIAFRLSDDFPGISTVPAGIQSQAYMLEISGNGINVSASSPAGLYHGGITLIQALENNPGTPIPECKIFDFPDMQYRGISDDISRGQVSTLENFKRIISFMARYKMNTYMPYIEDVLEFDMYPSIGKDRGALTKSEVKELVAFAREHFIDVIPVFQTLGHYENILSQPEFLKYAEFPGAASLNVSSEDTYVFLENLLKEVFEIFPSEYFHMGADESWDVGKGASAYRVEDEGLGFIHLKHYKRVLDICKKYNKKVMMYSDILLNHPEILPELPKDILIVDWHYRASEDYPSAKTFNDNGFRYFVSPAVWNFLTTFPTNLLAIPNISYFVKAGIENNATGFINSNWGDYGAETFKELVLFGYAFGAQASWNSQAAGPADFSVNYFNDFFGSSGDDASLIYQNLSNPLNQMQWHELWRHPLLEFRLPPWWGPDAKFSQTGKISWMDWTLGNLKPKIRELKKNATRNNDHADLLEYSLDLAMLYRDKINIQFALHKILKKEDADINSLIPQIDTFLLNLEKLNDQYRELWLRYYKNDNLNMIADKFNRLKEYFLETRESLNNGRLRSPEIKSDWIFYPEDSEVNRKSVKFRKRFKVEGKVESAFLQAIGETEVMISVNGNSIGHLYARRSLSLLVDYLCIGYYDISSMLVEGENTITVEAASYDRPAAGINVIAIVNSGGKEQEILSDTSWETAPQSSEVWIEPVKGEYRFTVIAPNFKTGRTSWIER
ncbi:MAG: family 20 glycosylhydrolase [Ignavibacteriales bacterium]|nr:family 20 glycosylhydrolase [Ignavibacteriales bacterium]MCF8316863.1 family 20 glycosylhydrolase [Ignavibacteriales bacterium]MCF8438098.1 family 20 glycosylhydrolase [Ignavibacteriales bacterium]